MATKTEKLFKDVKKRTWEYAKARYINPKEFTVKDNIGSNLGSTFVGQVTNKDSRDRFSLVYRAPVQKTLNDNGRVKRVVIDYDNGKWELVPRIGRGKIDEEGECNG